MLESLASQHLGYGLISQEAVEVAALVLIQQVANWKKGGEAKTEKNRKDKWDCDQVHLIKIPRKIQQIWGVWQIWERLFTVNVRVRACVWDGTARSQNRNQL